MKVDILAYIDAIENEFALDVYYNKKKGFFFRRFRPVKHENVYLAFLKLVVIIFTLPLFPFFTRLTLPNNSVGSLHFVCSKKSEVMFEGKGSAFGFFGGKRIVLCPPVLYFRYCVIVFYFVKKFKFNFWFYSEMSVIPEMIFLHEYLRRSDVSEINITNQYDRWALFISRVVSSDVHLNLHQHGIVSRDIIPAHKIVKINKLFCYDQEQSNIFSAHIAQEVGEIITKMPEIDLVDISSGLTVLICGTSDSSYKDMERKLIDKFLKFESILLCYKPHPLSEQKIFGRNLKLIDKNCYPKVDFMIHFASTLKIEYENSDPNVITFDATLSSVEDISEGVRERM